MHIDGQLLVDCRSRLAACWLPLELHAGRCVAEHRGRESQHFAAVGCKLDRVDRLHTHHVVDQPVPESQGISRTWWGIIWTWNDRHDSVARCYTRSSSAIHGRALTSGTRIVGLRIHERLCRYGSPCGRATDADATLRRNTRPEPAAG